MLLRIKIRCLAFCLLWPCLPAVVAAQTQPPPRIIFITFDGLRPQEVFQGLDPRLTNRKTPRLPTQTVFPTLKPLLDSGGVWAGRNQTGTVSNRSRISLPGYSNLMAGAETPCETNTCARIAVPTWLQTYKAHYGLEPRQLAVFASWKQIPLAATADPAAVYINAGYASYYPTPADSAAWHAINKAMQDDTHFGVSARSDSFTFVFAQDYVRRHSPSFIWLSLNETDEYGHKFKYHRHIQSALNYDRWLTTWLTGLANDPAYLANTWLVLTTDHGRGEGLNWRNHSRRVKGAQYIWAYIGKLGAPLRTDSATLKQAEQAPFSQRDFRPTLEALCGYAVPPLPNAGKPLQPWLDVFREAR
jgi:hypothetical protein